MADAVAVIDVPPRLDFPNGYSARYYHFLKALGRRLGVKLVVPETPDAGWSQSAFVEKTLEPMSVDFIEVPSNPLNAQTAAGRLRRMRHYLMETTPYMSYPRALDPDLIGGSSLLITFLPHLSHLCLGVEGPSAVCVLEEAWEKALYWGMANAGWAKRHLVIAGEHARLRRLHRALGSRAAFVAAISDSERDWFARSIPTERIAVLPHGVDAEYWRPSSAEKDLDLTVVGILSGGANLAGVLGLVEAAAGDLAWAQRRWAFVGRNPAPVVRAAAQPNMTIAADVPDVRPWYARSKVAVVPATFGAGAKTTILQAWASGTPVVATPFSIKGLPATPDENVLIGGSPGDLLRQVDQLLKSPDLREELAAAGRATVEQERDIRKIAEVFADRCVEAIE